MYHSYRYEFVLLYACISICHVARALICCSDGPIAALLPVAGSGSAHWIGGYQQYAGGLASCRVSVGLGVADTGDVSDKAWQGCRRAFTVRAQGGNLVGGLDGAAGRRDWVDG